MTSRVASASVQVREGLCHLAPQVGRCTPGFSRAAPVAHPVAIGTQERQVIQRGLAGPGCVEGEYVVNLDVVLAEWSVEPVEVEGADFALQRVAMFPGLRDLELPQVTVALAMQGSAGEEPTFDGRVSPVVDLLRIFRQLVQLPAADPFAQSRSSLKHLRWPGDESGDCLMVEVASLGGDTCVFVVECRQIRRFEADAAHGPELRVGLRRTFVNGQRPEQVREIRYAGISMAEALPSVLDDECAGQQQLVTGPCRARRHGQYRMSVRRHVRVGRSAMMCGANWEAIALSVGSVTLCDGWWQSVPVGQVWKEGA